MYLTTTQRSLINRTINAAETGRPDGDYSAISIYSDGPHHIKQITYGRAQTTEFGNLRKLVQMYAGAGGTYSEFLSTFASDIGSIALTDHVQFKQTLRDAGRNDPVMRRVQDQFFEQIYFIPAMRWADDSEFIKPLSMLVIFDSFIHSGQILWFLRSKFDESPPALGGLETIWISEYVNARHDWLATHSTKLLQKTIYRTAALKQLINSDNWDLQFVPIRMNGIEVFEE